MVWYGMVWYGRPRAALALGSPAQDLYVDMLSEAYQ